MITQLETEEFLIRQETLIDVRSPGEFLEGHIPGAVNLPILNDAHRAQVGTMYKKKGKEAAISLGHKLVDPLRDEILQNLREITDRNEVRLYCARGGLRSRYMASFFAANGLKVYILTGGYKSYRNAVLEFIGSFKKLIILSGFTGSGKTEILQSMSKQGAQVLDLEKLASHKGSAFGSLGMENQPLSSMFHNSIFNDLRNFNPNAPVWVENESHTIGKVFLPPVLWDHMKNAPGVELVLPPEERVRFTLQNYGNFTGEQLKGCVQNLKRRLGDEEMRSICMLIDEGCLEEAVHRLFKYYDKSYEYGRARRNCHNYVKMSFDKLETDKIARELLKLEHTFYN